jgi:hypothetical protein
MVNKQQVNKLFNDILGVNVKVIGDESTLDEKTFCYIIDKWENAWKTKTKLLIENGLAFDGYDGMLYDTIDALIVIHFGKEKADIIHWYVYESKDENDVAYAIVNKKTQEEFILKTSKDLYKFLSTVNPQDFLYDKQIENDPDEEDEE